MNSTERTPPAGAKQLLLDMLAIATVNGEDNEAALAEYIAQYLGRAGLAPQLHPVCKGRSNLSALVKGRDSSRTLVLNGHLDTVPYGSLAKWQTNPAVPTEKDGLVFARGASDMKSGLAAYLYALCSLAENGETPFCDILFLATCDEEKGGLGAKQFVNSLPQNTAALIIGEPTGNALGLAQKGCLWLQLTVQGKTSHGAYPQEGVNALEKGFALAGQLAAFAGLHSHPLLGASTAQVTMAKGGIAPNMTPDSAEFLLDIRPTPPFGAGHIEAWLQDALHSGAWPAFSWQAVNSRTGIETPPENPYAARLAESIRQATGGSPGAIGVNFFTDASILNQNHPGLPVVLFGPGLPELAHKPNEYVSLQQYYQAIQSLRLFLAQAP
ncbi:MAG: M20 family metallopeptidase [Oscillospiraceae bacterium]